MILQASGTDSDRIEGSIDFQSSKEGGILSIRKQLMRKKRYQKDRVAVDKENIQQAGNMQQLFRKSLVPEILESSFNQIKKIEQMPDHLKKRIQSPNYQDSFPQSGKSPKYWQQNIVFTNSKTSRQSIETQMIQNLRAKMTEKRMVQDGSQKGKDGKSTVRFTAHKKCANHSQSIQRVTLQTCFSTKNIQTHQTLEMKNFKQGQSEEKHEEYRDHSNMTEKSSVVDFLLNEKEQLLQKLLGMSETVERQQQQIKDLKKSKIVRQIECEKAFKTIEVVHSHQIDSRSRDLNKKVNELQQQLILKEQIIREYQTYLSELVTDKQLQFDLQHGGRCQSGSAQRSLPRKKVNTEQERRRLKKMQWKIQQRRAQLLR